MRLFCCAKKFPKVLKTRDLPINSERFLFSKNFCRIVTQKLCNGNLFFFLRNQSISNPKKFNVYRKRRKPFILRVTAGIFGQLRYIAESPMFIIAQNSGFKIGNSNPWKINVADFCARHRHLEISENWMVKYAFKCLLALTSSEILEKWIKPFRLFQSISRLIRRGCSSPSICNGWQGEKDAANFLKLPRLISWRNHTSGYYVF